MVSQIEYVLKVICGGDGLLNASISQGVNSSQDEVREGGKAERKIILSALG